MPFQSLYSNIFSSKGHHSDDNDMLAELTERYPYFSLAHFFLLKNTEGSNPAYSGIAAKTALHFNNPFLLHEQLHQSPVQDNLTAGILEPEPGPPVQESQDILPVVETEAAGEPLEEVETVLPAEIILQEEIGQDLAPLDEESTSDVNLPANIARADEEVAPHPEMVEMPLQVIGQEVPVVQEVVVPENTPPAAASNDTGSASAITPVSEQPEKDIPLFEPLSASDYFASQGIKITEEQQPTDRMGKQLKSFTAWLKTMKKVHDNKLPGTEGTVDVVVQTLAEKSNKEEEILTEAMAEVYLQQGKSNKAKEIYEKLSLLNPAKSAYFAAKLEQIK